MVSNEVLADWRIRAAATVTVMGVVAGLFVLQSNRGDAGNERGDPPAGRVVRVAGSDYERLPGGELVQIAACSGDRQGAASRVLGGFCAETTDEAELCRLMLQGSGRAFNSLQKLWGYDEHPRDVCYREGLVSGGGARRAPAPGVLPSTASGSGAQPCMGT